MNTSQEGRGGEAFAGPPVVSTTTTPWSRTNDNIILKLSPQESTYYSTVWQLAGPDMGDYISGEHHHHHHQQVYNITKNDKVVLSLFIYAIIGPKAASVLQLSGLSRNILHQIWAIADREQEGKLDENGSRLIIIHQLYDDDYYGVRV